MEGVANEVNMFHKIRLIEGLTVFVQSIGGEIIVFSISGEFIVK